MKRAASSPASDLLHASFVKKKVAMEVKLANIGAIKTQTFLMSTGNEKNSAVHLKEAAVAMRPGKIVPPMTLPRGNQDSESNQFQKLYMPSCARYLVVLKLNQGSNS